MFMVSQRLLGVVLFGLILAAGQARGGGPASVEGTVTDIRGQPLQGAEIRIATKEKGGYAKTFKSDAKGHYSSEALAPDRTYHVTLIVNNEVKASISNVKAKLGEPTKMNFDLKAAQSGKKGKHFVYVPASTGTHMGGHWVEVDENGSTVNADTERVERVGGGAVGSLQRNSGGHLGGGN